MAYSKDLRLCIVNNVKNGMTWDEAVRIFQISRQTLSKWLQMEKNGDLSDKPRKEYKTRKIATAELKEIVGKEPDWTLAQYAEHFNCSHQAIANRLKKLGIIRKKNTSLSKK